MKYTYLLIDFFSVIVPFMFSFHPKLRFDRHWGAFLPAMLISGLLFLAWDGYFTHLKIWGFNPDYLLGIYIGNLPLEEVFFFLCIPYACLFTYVCLERLIAPVFSKPVQLAVSVALIVVSVLLFVIFYEHYYTGTTFSILACLLIAAQFMFKVKWLPRFYVTYAILLFPFMIVNGLLTGTALKAPVVWYNQAHIMGLRLLTIPVEDVFYGMNLILLNLMIYKLFSALIFRRRKMQRRTASTHQLTDINA